MSFIGGGVAYPFIPAVIVQISGIGVSTASLGGDHFTVDTGIVIAVDEIHKYEVQVLPSIAHFLVDDVVVATIDTDDTAFPDIVPRPWELWLTDATGVIATLDIIYQLPWIVAIQK